MAEPTRTVRPGWSTVSSFPAREALAPTLAAAVAVAVLAARWRGVDLAAHIYDVEQFRRQGLVLWDSQWFAGRWLLGYSVIYSPIAATIGLRVTAVASAVVAAWSFDRLVRARFGSVAAMSSTVFAVATLAQVAIGQLPYLLGEAFALLALVCAHRKWWVPAVTLAVATTLASPLAGAFLALAAASWLIGTWPRHRVALAAVCVAALGPVLVLQLLFPQGTMAYPVADFGFELGAFVVLAALMPSEERTLRVGASLYALALVTSYLIPTGVGGTIIRLGGCVALPLALVAIAPGLRRALGVMVLLPVLVLTWAPVWASATSGRHDDSTKPSYYKPLIRFLDIHARPAGRVEVIPTALHWEAVYVAPVAPLARGWERQLDTLDNPIFYTRGALTPSSYRTWLLNSGVRFVALADARPDFAGQAEARLVARSPSGLVEVWHSAHWKVFEVVGSRGIIDGPATLAQLSGNRLVIHADHAGRIQIHLRPTDHWAISSGAACLERTAATATTIDARRPGTVILRLGVLPTSDARADASAC